MGKGADAVPDGHDRSCPGPGGGDFEAALAAAAHQAAVCVEEAVTQRFGFGLGQVAVEGDRTTRQPSPGVTPAIEDL